MTDNAAEFAVDELDPEDPEPTADADFPPNGELPLEAADEGDAFEQSRAVPLDEDEYR